MGAAHTNQWITFLIIAVVWIVIFYFISVLPAKKKKQKQKELFSEMVNGDILMTIGGIRGEYAGEKDEQFIYLKVDKGVKLTIKRTAIAGKINNN